MTYAAGRLVFAIFFCCAMISTGSVSAQTPDLSKYFTVKELGVRTTHKFTSDFNFEAYSGEQNWAGIQNMIFAYYYENYDEDEIPKFELKRCEVWLKDVYGREIKRCDFIEEIEDGIEALIEGVSERGDHAPFVIFDLARGGEYVFGSFIDFLNIDKEEPVTVYDNPSIRIIGDNLVKVGNDVQVTAFFNTGYPYDINSLTGEEYADVTLFKMETDSTAYELDKQRYPLLKLKDEAHPLLAGIDTVTVKMEKPEPGLYVLRYETNWTAVEGRDIYITVEDTLRATVTLDKEAYDLATDKSGRMTMTMDYRYPHIGAVRPDVEPTIRVFATLFKDKELKDSLMTDSLILVSDTLATKDLHYKGDWDLDWTKIDAAKLADIEEDVQPGEDDPDSAEDDGTYQLKVTIHFNGSQQFKKVIPVAMTPVPVGISPATALRSDDEAIYTLSGLRVNTRHPLKSGIYVRKGKKIIGKKFNNDF